MPLNEVTWSCMSPIILRAFPALRLHTSSDARAWTTAARDGAALLVLAGLLSIGAAHDGLQAMSPQDRRVLALSTPLVDSITLASEAYFGTSRTLG